jgi:hypothetical protein
MYVCNYICLDTELSLQRGVDMSLVPNLDTIIESQQNISQVHREERTFIIGPNGGRAGLVMQEIIMEFNTSDLAAEDMSSKNGVSKEVHINMYLNELKNELKVTKPKLNICRFWAQKVA